MPDTQIAAEPRVATAGARRLASVDGVRGVAIAMVVVGHLIGFAGLLGQSPLYSTLFPTPLHVFWDETGAVQVFFVLSGFVLQFGMPAEMTALAARRFLVARFFRLYPLYLVGLLFALACRALWAGHASLTAFNPGLGIFWNQPVQWQDLASHVLPLFPTAVTSNIDAVLWSIFVEFKFSLLFPIIAVCVGLAEFDIAAFLAFLAGSFFYSWLSPADSAGRFLFHFVLGAALAQTAPVWHVARGRHWNLIGTVFAVCLLELRYASYAPHLTQPQFDLLSALASGLLLVCVVRSPMLQQLFASRPLVWLGRRTYGIYLFHFPILLLTLSWLTARLGSARLAVWSITAGVTIAASLPLAAAAYRWVELPANAFGKQIARRPAGTPRRG